MPYNIVNLDSLNGCVFNTSNQFNSYTFNTNYLNLAPNAFNATFKLQTPLSNVKKIHLKSIEIPIGFNNVRAASKTNIIAVSADPNNANPYSISLPDKTYNSVATLISDINAYFVALYPTINLVFGVKDGYTFVASTSGTIFNTNIFIIPTNLSYMLGFRNTYNNYVNVYTATVTDASSPFGQFIALNGTRITNAPAVYLLNIDNYINMYISNISTANTHNANGVLCHFKIITNTINGVVYYVSENNSYSQYIEMNSYIPISELSISFTDRFGYSLSASGLDYSCTFCFET